MSIVVEELGFSYCTRRVLSGVSFAAEPGELLAVLGANGVGKTTLFRCILGLHRKYTGKITIDGEDAAKLSPREMAHRIAYIPQMHGTAFGFSVRDMVLMGTSHEVSCVSVPGRKEQAAAEEAIEKLGIARLADKNFAHLSGGEQQLVMIARALAQRAGVLLMDEPTAALDYGNREQVLKTVKALAREGYTVIMSTHDPQSALWYADRVLALECGRTAAFGAPEDVMDAALIERLYGTKVEMLKTERGTLLWPETRGEARLDSME